MMSLGVVIKKKHYYHQQYHQQEQLKQHQHQLHQSISIYQLRIGKEESKDSNLFPTIKRDADWKDFSDKMLLEAKAQLVDGILNPTYRPGTKDEKIYFS